MQTKVVEIRDASTFIPAICIKPIPENEQQRWLLRRDGYSGSSAEHCVIVIKTHSGKAQYDPFYWEDRTMQTAHQFIETNWDQVLDGDVIDVEYILGESTAKKKSERYDYA